MPLRHGSLMSSAMLRRCWRAAPTTTVADGGRLRSTTAPTSTKARSPRRRTRPAVDAKCTVTPLSSPQPTPRCSSAASASAAASLQALLSPSAVPPAEALSAVDPSTFEDVSELIDDQPAPIVMTEMELEEFDIEKPVRLRRGKATTTTTAKAASPPSVTPSRPKREERTKGSSHATGTVRLDNVMQEWMTLRQQCRAQLQHDSVSGDARSSNGTAAAAVAAAATSATVSLANSAGLSSVRNGQNLLNEVLPAERAVLLSVLAKETASYPQLSRLFLSFDAQKGSGNAAKATTEVAVDVPSQWEVTATASLLSSELTVLELLALLRVHAYTSWQSKTGIELHDQVWTTLISALQRALTQAPAQSPEKQRQTLALVLHVLVDLHRYQLSCSGNAAAVALSKPTRASSSSSTKKRKGGVASKTRLSSAEVQQRGEEAAVHVRMQRVLTELVPLVQHNLAGPIERGSHGVGTGVTRLMVAAVSALAVESGALLQHLSAISVAPKSETQGEEEDIVGAVSILPLQEWRTWHDEALKSLLSHLEAQATSSSSSATRSGDAAAVVVYLLQCLRWSEELEVVLRAGMLRTITDLCQQALLCLCRGVATTAAAIGLFERLCSTEVAIELGRLMSDRVGYAQAVTDICTVAAVYLQHAPERLPALVDACERDHLARMAERSGAPPGQLPLRPPLHTPLAQLIYAMLCAGFAAPALLTSGLCLTLTPRDAVDVVRAADFFSAACATSPLPVRTRAVVVEQVTHLLLQCRRDRHRAVANAEEEEALQRQDPASFGLAARMESGASAVTPPSMGLTSPHAGPATGAHSTRRSSGRAGKKGAGRGAGALVPVPQEGQRGDASSANASEVILTPAAHRAQVNHILYVSVSSIVEMLLRGDSVAVEQLAHALLPLLQSEGREAALTEALECIWSDFRRRLSAVGSHDLAAASHQGSHGSALAGGQMTLAMEQALTLLSTLFLPHVTESAVKLLTGTGTNGVGGIGGGGATLRVPVRAAPHRADGRSAAAAASTAGTTSAETLRELALRLSTVAILCGLPASSVAQLTTLHNSLLKLHLKASAAAVNGDGTQPVSRAVSAAFAVVERLERLLTELRRQSLPWRRHPDSAHRRAGSVAVHQLLALYLVSTSSVVREVLRSASSSQTLPQQYRHYLLTVVHLLYRLSTEYAVETEAAALRSFRVEVLDPALTKVLQSPTGENNGASPTALQMPLTTLTEVVVVMCVADSVQHVSPALIRGIVAGVEGHLRAREAAGAEAALSTNAVTGVLATQLLSAAATLCLRADDGLTSQLMRLLELLSPRLSLQQAVSVVRRLHETGAPLPAPPVRHLLKRLVTALQSAGENGASEFGLSPSPMEAAQGIRILHLLSAVHSTVAGAAAEQRWSTVVADADVAALRRLLRKIPYDSLLTFFAQQELLERHAYGIAECGMLVEVVAQCGQGHGESRDAFIMADAASGGQLTEQVHGLPRRLAVYVLQAVQRPYDVHDVPPLLRGYAALRRESTLRQQVLRSFIARTMRAAPALTPVELVECVEAYGTASVAHPQLYGVLLGQAADAGRKLSLELSVRLLRCGTLAGDPSLRTACVTAVQPIFSAQVRRLLLSDPHMLVSVASTALAILHCLGDCFPHDAISAAVLANVARYQHDASLPVVKAALELVSRRGSEDYDVVHILAGHCTESVFPTCSAGELANLTYLLVACGLRSAELLEACYRRLAEVAETMQGVSLARLAEALLQAAVEVDAEAVQHMCDRVVSLAESSSNSRAVDASALEAQEDMAGEGAEAVLPITLQQVSVFMHFLRTVRGRARVAAMTTVDALLNYTQAMVETAVRDASAAIAMTEFEHAEDDGEEGELRTPTRKAKKSSSAVEMSASLPAEVPLLAAVEPRELEGLLRTCIDMSSKPKRYSVLVRHIADDVQRRLGFAVAAADTAAVDLLPASSSMAWHTDLILLVDLCSLFIRLGETKHPVVRLILDRLYERRGTLLQRALLVKTTRLSLEAAGEEAHPELYRLIVAGELA